MSNAVNMSVRVDRDVKSASEELFEEIGMPISVAINIFLRQCIRCGGLPFDVKLDSPNKETREAIEEARKLASSPAVKGMTFDEYVRETDS